MSIINDPDLLKRWRAGERWAAYKLAVMKHGPHGPRLFSPIQTGRQRVEYPGRVRAGKWWHLPLRVYPPYAKTGPGIYLLRYLLHTGYIHPVLGLPTDDQYWSIRAVFRGRDVIAAGLSWTHYGWKETVVVRKCQCHSTLS